MDDDTVVREVPVFLCRRLADRLYVFQYPTGNGNGPGTDGTAVSGCRVRPRNRMVKIDTVLDERNYDSSKAEGIAAEADGLRDFLAETDKDEDKDRETHFESGFMDRMQYRSAAPVSDSSKYTVGVLRDGRLHVTPVTAVLQMRPSYAYLDRPGRASSPSDADDAPAPITVSFARNETERVKRARERSYGFLTERSEREPWCECVWRRRQSRDADTERRALSATPPARRGAADLRPDEYLASLVPRDPEREPSDASLGALGRLPPADRCRETVRAAKLVTAPWVTEVTGVSGAPLLTALAAAGRLLRGGRWAARSSLLYPPGSASRDSGVPDRLMCRARDYVLYLFTRSDLVDGRKVAAATKLPPEEVREILSSVATYQRGAGWRLSVPPDPDFETRHPEVELRQSHFWNARQRQFNEMLSGEPPTARRQRRKSRRDSAGSDAGLASPGSDPEFPAEGKRGRRRNKSKCS